MATQEYITINDITTSKIKQVSDPVKQSYVDRTNNWYEEYALSKDIAIDDINYPLSEMVMELLRNKLTMTYSLDNINGSDNTLDPSVSIYTVLYEGARAEFISLAETVNESVIRGYINSASTTRVTSRAVRS